MSSGGDPGSPVFTHKVRVRSSMLLSLWCLIPWCGVQAGPAEPPLLLAHEDVSFGEPDSLGSGPDPVGPRVSIARRSIDRRVDRIGTSRQPRADRESFHVD